METFFEDLNSKKNYLGEEFEQQIDTKLRTIYICDTIEEDTYKRFCFFFNRLDSSPGEITIHLTSLGGDATLSLGIYDLISSAKNCVVIKCYGNVYSGATLILQGGAVRLASEECRFLIHDVSGGLHHQRSQDLLDGAMETKYLAHRIALLYQKHSKLSMKSIKRFMRSETFLSTKEALQFGLIDGYVGNTHQISPPSCNIA